MSEEEYTKIWNELPDDQRAHFTSMILQMSNGFHNNKVVHGDKMPPLSPSKEVLCPHCDKKFKHLGCK